MAFHNTLTSFLGVNATEYAPNHETSTEFMNAKFEEVLDNDKWLKENCMRIYKSLQEIDSSFTINTPVKDVILAMDDNSMAMYNTPPDDAGVYPTVLGTVIITKQSIDRNYVQCSHPTDCVWHTSYHSIMNPDCEWEKLLVGEDLESRGVVETKPNLPQNADANTITENGIYQIWNSETQEAINFPIANPIGTLTVDCGGSFPVQTFTSYQGMIWTRSRGVEVNEWTAWMRVTTQSQYTITSSMFKNGWSQYNGHQYTKLVKTGNFVNLVGYVNIGSTNSDTIIFTVPAGYRPKVTQAIDRWNISFRLNTDGTLRVFSTSVTSGTIDLNGICWEV